jgi:hypothetical protein
LLQYDIVSITGHHQKVNAGKGLKDWQRSLIMADRKKTAGGRCGRMNG